MKVAEAWKAFGEKTQFLDSGVGRKVVVVAAIAMVIYAVVGLYDAGQTHDAQMNKIEQSYDIAD